MFDSPHHILNQVYRTTGVYIFDSDDNSEGITEGAEECVSCGWAEWYSDIKTKQTFFSLTLEGIWERFINLYDVSHHE